jgi:hypothetical protein
MSATELSIDTEPIELSIEESYKQIIFVLCSKTVSDDYKFGELKRFILSHFSAKSDPIHDTDGFIRSFLKQLNSGNMNWTELDYPNRYLTLHLSAIIVISTLFQEYRAELKNADSTSESDSEIDYTEYEYDYRTRAFKNAQKEFNEVPSKQFDEDEKRNFNKDFWTSVIGLVFESRRLFVTSVRSRKSMDF